jgi:hypothetical protein
MALRRSRVRVLLGSQVFPAFVSLLAKAVRFAQRIFTGLSTGLLCQKISPVATRGIPTREQESSSDTPIDVLVPPSTVFAWASVQEIATVGVIASSGTKYLVRFLFGDTRHKVVGVIAFSG